MKTGLLRIFETLMVAVTFAEKNDHEYAIRLMNSDARKKNQRYSRRDLNNQPENRPQMRL